MSTVTPAVCRVCMTACPILVEVEDGRAVRVAGDRDNAVFGGYTCVKGRAQHTFLNDPARVRHSLKRGDDGVLRPIPVEQAMDEIAARLRTIIDRDGPRSLAHYFGTIGYLSVPTGPLASSLMAALGSRMQFGTATIDKSGKRIARAMHGYWMAPLQGYDRPEIGLLIGVNPFVSYQGLPVSNPGKWLAAESERGFRMIVIDPRRSDVAKRAWLHLQPRPGFDVELLASMIHVILEEDLGDRSFVAENVHGVDTLRAAVEPFTPARVGRLADVPDEQLVLAARAFAGARRGYAFAGTGPSMSGPSTLTEYLVLALETLCGHWLREGEVVRNPGTFVPALTPKAQARSPQPAYGVGEPIRVRGLTGTPAGMPTAALAEEILLEGEGRIRALISCGGNPVAAWPDELRTIDAMEDLELLVQLDAWMSQTARYATYVIACKMPLETPAISIVTDADISHGVGYSHADSYGQYSPAVVEPPDDSEVIDEWEFYYGIACRLGLPLVVNSLYTIPITPFSLDGSRKPTTDELIELLTGSARVPLGDIKAHPHGALFPSPEVRVGPPDPDAAGHLDVGNADMLRDLSEHVPALTQARDDAAGHLDLRLVARRMSHVYNSSYNVASTNRGRGYNPAYMHPDDLAALGLDPGDTVAIRSARSSIQGIVAADGTLRRGLVSMTHGFGSGRRDDGDMRTVGGSTSRLARTDDAYDRYSGQPRMSNIRVQVTRVEDPDDA
jgi:anaerobic selenocysteine-containing dehydrogenase